jgi:hypothetical protein
MGSPENTPCFLQELIIWLDGCAGKNSAKFLIRAVVGCVAQTRRIRFWWRENAP